MAIKKAAELDFSSKKFMVILSGQPGLGKTTLALSAPKPFLFDTDNGIARVKAAHRQDVITSVTASYEELLSDMDTPEYKDAQTVVIDTGGTLVQLMKDWAKKSDPKAAKDGRGIFMEDETAYLIDGVAFCRACVRKEITENTPFETFLATFGVESIPADELEDKKC